MTTTRTLRRLTLGGLLVTATILPAPSAALASDAGVSPVPVHPGRDVMIVTRCSVNATSASISATVLGGAPTIPMQTTTQQPGDWMVSLTVPDDAAAGAYELAGTCGEGDGFTAVVVVSTSIGPSGGGGWAVAGPDDTLLVIGSAIATAAVAGGVLLLRRRTPIPGRVRRHGRP